MGQLARAQLPCLWREWGLAVVGNASLPRAASLLPRPHCWPCQALPLCKRLTAATLRPPHLTPPRMAMMEMSSFFDGDDDLMIRA